MSLRNFSIEAASGPISVFIDDCVADRAAAAPHSQAVVVWRGRAGSASRWWTSDAVDPEFARRLADQAVEAISAGRKPPPSIVIF